MDCPGTENRCTIEAKNCAAEESKMDAATSTIPAGLPSPAVISVYVEYIYALVVIAMALYARFQNERRRVAEDESATATQAVIAVAKAIEETVDSSKKEIELIAGKKQADVYYKKTKGIIKAVVQGSESAEMVADVVRKHIHGDDGSGAVKKPHTQRLGKIE